MRVTRRVFALLAAGAISPPIRSGIVSAAASSNGAENPSAQLAVIGRLYNDVWNNQDLKATEEIFTSGHQYHDPATPGIGIGPTGYRQLVQLYSSAASNIQFTINDLAMSGDRVAVRWRAAGTHDGEFNGIAPTGNALAVLAMGIYRFEGDQIAETWVDFDALGFLAQLGALPAPAPNPVGEPLPAIALSWVSSSQQFAACALPIETVGRRLYEVVWNDDTPALLSQYVTADYRYVDPSFAPMPPGPDAYGAFMSAMRTAIPDLDIEIADSVASGDTVVLRWTGTGSQHGDLLGVPATGRNVSIEAMSFLTFAGDKIAVNWSVFDALGLLTQLGVIPAA